ncbi:hypothetical protein ACV940_003664 [Pseudomonas aeruginosa]
MNKANECTCPSGDGSLVHPCPAHPAVEQVGGDERAVDGKPRATKCPDCGEGDLMPGDLCACGYETDPSAGYACSECDGSGDGYVGEVCRECDGSGWFVTPEQARAALAQLSGEVVVTENESGAIVSVTRQDKEGRVLSVIAESATLTAQAEQAEAERPEGPTEDELEAAGLGYPLHKEEAVKLWYSGFRSEVITVLEAWEAIGHDTGINPDKEELLESLRNMAAICNAHGNDMPAQSAIDQRQVIADAITGALAFGAQASQPPAEDHWLRPFYDIGRAEGQRTQELAMLVRMLAASLKRHAPESNLVARATNYLAAKGLAGTPLRDAPASVEQAGGDRWDALQSIMEWTAAENIPDDRKLCLIRNAARAALAHAPTSSASPSCKWTESSGIWETGCGQTWSFVEDGPAENGALFCHHCGGRLALIKSDDQEDDGGPCPECMEHGCNGECAGHGAMGD